MYNIFTSLIETIQEHFSLNLMRYQYLYSITGRYLITPVALTLIMMFRPLCCNEVHLG